MFFCQETCIGKAIITRDLGNELDFHQNRNSLIVKQNKKTMAVSGSLNIDL